MAVDRDAYRKESLETWGEMSPGWEARYDWMVAITGLVNEWLVDRSDPQPGQTFIDIAAGPGSLGFDVAERVGDRGRVISTDFAPEMIDVARRMSERRGVSNVELEVLDAERMHLEDDCVDGAVCRFGYMLMADPASALRETKRILRPGGPLAFAVWASPERNPWATLPAMTLIERGHMAPPEPGAPGIFAMADPELIRELVIGAGFDDPEIEEIDFHFRHVDANDVWDALVRLAGPLAHVINALDPDERQATRAAVEEALGPFRAADGSYAEPARALGVLTH